jgi:curved DNA-binding protein
MATGYKDYYKILGVKRDADAETIQKQFRKLARQYHPDVNPGDKAAEERFKEISEAYDVLGNPDKRHKYDGLGGRGGFESVYGAGGNSGGANPFGNFGPFAEMIDQLFRQSGGGGSPASGGRRGADREADVQITLQEAASGTTRMLVGDGYDVQVKIPPGVDTGSRVRIAGQGGRSAGDVGDLYINVQVHPDPRFERRGDDLYTDVDVSLYVALLGGKVNVPTLDGAATLNIPAETANGQLIRLKDRGVPNLKDKGRVGSLYARVRVILPQKLTAEEKRLFEELRKKRDFGTS